MVADLEKFIFGETTYFDQEKFRKRQGYLVGIDELLLIRVLWCDAHQMGK